ncbi:MAG: hypothetical protein HY046_09350, partial [Acidobacteria bacterium]|nr:hypothetical protein [Acidobacteriota bacterium]
MNPVPPAVAPYLLAERNGFRWFHVEDVKGPGLPALAAEFGLHDLAVEDCRTPGTRAKLEEYEHHLFIVVNTIHFEPEKHDCWFAEFNVFLSKDFIITVHDGPSRTAAAVKPRMEGGHIKHPALAFYELARTIVGRYFPVLDTIEEKIDSLEDRAYERPTPALIAEI